MTRFTLLLSLCLSLAIGVVTCAPAAPAPTPKAAVSSPTTAPASAPTLAAPAATTAPAAAPTKPAAAASTAVPTKAAAASPAVPAKQEKVKLAVVVKGGGFANFYFALNKGFYRQEGLDLEIVEMASSLHVPALTSGQIDFTGVTDQAFTPGLKGLPIKAVAVTIGKPTWYIIGGPGINTLNDIKGKPVAVNTIGTTSHYAVRKALQDGGLDPNKDVTYVPMTGRPERFAALKSGAIGASFFSTPDQVVAEKEYGFKILVDMGKMLDFPLDGLGTSDKKLKENPDYVKRMLRATLYGMRYMRENREETTQYFTKELKLSQESAKVLYDDLMKTYAFDGLFTDKGLEQLIQANIESGDLKGPRDQVKVEMGLDQAPLKQVLAELAR